MSRGGNCDNLQESLAANSLEHLGVVGPGGLLADGQALKGVRLHGSANGSHGAEERELAALDSAGGRSDNDGRHVEYVVLGGFFFLELREIYRDESNLNPGPEETNWSEW